MSAAASSSMSPTTASTTTISTIIGGGSNNFLVASLSLHLSGSARVKPEWRAIVAKTKHVTSMSNLLNSASSVSGAPTLDRVLLTGSNSGGGGCGSGGSGTTGLIDSLDENNYENENYNVSKSNNVGSTAGERNSNMTNNRKTSMSRSKSLFNEIQC